jgi:PPK2 family polyphosphate:nucleotide phosphotransferase
MSRESFWTEDPKLLLRVEPGFQLITAPTDTRPGFDGNKAGGVAALAEGALVLADLQERLYANHQAGDDGRRVLLVLQAMDTAGKGGIIKHVMGSVDPQGVQLAAFKKPTEEELAHDFLWRIRKESPQAGKIGVFDRSHYEDVLIGRVRELAAPEEIERRYGAINEFEAELVDEGTTIVKVMLHISAAEQKVRLLDRLERPEKQWKFNPGDIEERMLWPKYQDAYQVVFDRTSTPIAPWYVVPADRKWYARLAVQHLLIDALEAMDLQWPAVEYDVEAEKARLLAAT